LGRRNQDGSTQKKTEKSNFEWALIAWLAVDLFYSFFLLLLEKK